MKAPVSAVGFRFLLTRPSVYSPNFVALEALLRSRSYLFLLLVLGLAGLSVGLLNVRPVNYGLDVKGGVRIIYDMDQKDLQKSGKKPADVADKILRTLERRVSSSLGVVEGSVARKGETQYVVELPGYTDEKEAEKILGRAASLKFYHARTLVTELNRFRPYTDMPGQGDTTNPEVWFQRTGGSGDVIKPGTPEYQQVIDSWGAPIIVGDELANARPSGVGDNVIPELFFSPSGSAKMEKWTRDYMNQREKLAAVLDGVVLSAPAVERGTILKEGCVITGKFTHEYVVNLVNLLQSGALPVQLNQIGVESVDPTIGNYALNQMITAGAVAFGVIALFMLAYYAFPGLIAVFALALYVLFTITVLRLIGATFSLAAIAGFVLSVGMAVDANILVFERFKEEIKSGKSLQSAIELGFKRALPAIIDSNACTILTSLVLAQLGSGPVKGFATTLIIGVAISLFTAITVTRSLLMFFIGSGLGTNPKWYAVNRNWFGNVEERASHNPIKVVEASKKWFALSIVTIVIFLPFVFLGGFKFNVEFRGGYQVGLSMEGQTQTRAAIEDAVVKAGYPGANVKMGSAMVKNADGTTKAVPMAIVSIPATQQGNDNTAAADIAQKIGAATGLKPTGDSSYVGPTIQKEMINNAILGVLISSALIVVYLAFRFGFAVGNFILGLRFGFSAIIALLHDILVVFGITAFFGYLEHWEISSLFITSMLTVIGFSVHDTIVIFDRIRENLRKAPPGEQFDHLVDRSITQSFARSINTSMTVVVTLFILLFIGTPTPDLKLFCVTMLAGIISGTYSSIFNASPILYLWDLAIGKKKGEGATLMGAARHEAAAARIVAPTVSPEPMTTATTRSYGQVRRRASASKKIEIEEP